MKSWLSVLQFISIKLGWGTQRNLDNSKIKQNINIKTVLKDEYLNISQELLHVDKKLNIYTKIKRNVGQEKYLPLNLKSNLQEINNNVQNICTQLSNW